ncbi:hypothetical protein [Microbacterium sp. NPDC089188]|uniref:hypothetical protein n=1 Tax=Microbacterium sp. NPDC089188 TaxID=3154971 RepID=UPI003439C04F
MSTSLSSTPVEPFIVYLRRRGASATALTPGEVVTAAVGLLRGCRSAAVRGGGAAWWLTAEGRPVVVEDHGAPDVVASTADGLRRLAVLVPDPTTRGLIDRAGEVVATRPPREWDAVERRLFAHADPAPLVLGPLTPVVIEERAEDRDDALTGGPLGLLDDDLFRTIRNGTAGLRERWASSPRFRAAVIGVGVLAVAAVVSSVFLPEVREPAPVASSTPHVSRIAPPTMSITPRPSATSPWPADDRVPLSDDIVEVARRVFGEISRCGDDPECRSAFDEGSTFTREPLLPDAEHADIALLEDFGGVAVVSVADADRAQYVTLVRHDDKWLVRAVETVADQPS